MSSRKITSVCVFLIILFNAYTCANAQKRKNEKTWKTHVEFSYLNTSGNTDTQTLSGRLEFNKEKLANRYFIKGNALYAEDKNEETVNKWSLDGRWERVFTERLFGHLSALYMEDKFSGYDYRVAGGPGLGYEMIKTESHHLKTLASILYYYDYYSDEFKGPGDKSDDYAAGKAEINYAWQILKNIKFKENADYTTSFESGDKYFINSETALETKLNTYLSLGLSYIIAYQNFLPSPDTKHTDTTSLVSLIMDF